MDPVTAKLLDYGLTGLLILLMGGVYLKVIRPDNKERELERDRLISERMQALIEQMRIKDKEAADEKAAIRKEHAEAWEQQRKQMKDERDIAREERAEDRQMFREMISGIGAGLSELHKGQARNFGLTLALGERLGYSKKELASRTEHISGQPVPPNFTQDETNY